MVNLIEKVCLLENWNQNISMNDKDLELQPQQLLLPDPYDSVWLKIIAILSYFIGLVSSVIMLAFVNYETGHHGNFRTVINQLVSNMYAMVSKKIYFHTFSRVLRCSAPALGFGLNNIYGGRWVVQSGPSMMS